MVLKGGLVESLWRVVKRSSEASMRRSAAGCLWTVAEADIEERRRLAELMTSSTFVDFISSVCGPLGGVGDKSESSELLIIGAQGIEVCAPHIDMNIHFNRMHQLALLSGHCSHLTQVMHLMTQEYCRK